MKKLAVIAILFALLFSATACNKVYFDEEKYKSEVEKQSIQNEKELSERNSQIAEDKTVLESELGKTETNKKIVVKFTYGDHIEYEEVIFDKKGMSTEKYIYKYFDTDSYYEMVLGDGDDGNNEMVGHDDNLRMIKYRNKKFIEIDFETMLKLYERKDAEICQIIK